jgi:hypothetical protein
MNLVPIYPPTCAWGWRITCTECGRTGRPQDCYADTDGKAFEAYYCARCAAPKLKEAHGPADSKTYPES